MSAILKFKKWFNNLRLRFYKWNQRAFSPDFIPIYQKGVSNEDNET